MEGWAGLGLRGSTEGRVFGCALGWLFGAVFARTLHCWGVLFCFVGGAVFEFPRLIHVITGAMRMRVWILRVT